MKDSMQKKKKKKLTGRFEEALIFALSLHSGQTRKGTDIPYAAHLLSAAALVIEDGGTEDEAISALLHDAVEDRGGEKILEQIKEKFGNNAARMVEACSDTKVFPKPPWRERKERFLEKLKEAPQDVLRIVAADKLHNVRSIIMDFRAMGDELWGRFSGKKEGTLWYYRTCAEIVKSRMTNSQLAEELYQSVKHLERMIF